MCGARGAVTGRPPINPLEGEVALELCRGRADVMRESYAPAGPLDAGVETRGAARPLEVVTLRRGEHLRTANFTCGVDQDVSSVEPLPVHFVAPMPGHKA